MKGDGRNTEILLGIFDISFIDNHYAAADRETNQRDDKKDREKLAGIQRIDIRRSDNFDARNIRGFVR